MPDTPKTRRKSSAATLNRESSSPPPIPTIPLRKRSYNETLETIIRDFAYDPGDDLFHRPAIQEDTIKDDSEDAEQITGFDGPPPWLQSTLHNGMVSEDDLTTSSVDELHGRAVALFDFEPEHENEFALHEGQVIYISSRHGQGWLVAVDIRSGDCGLVPEEYVRILDEDDADYVSDEAKQEKDEWEDEAEEVEMSDEERQKIMMQAERDMAIAEHKNMKAAV